MSSPEQARYALEPALVAGTDEDECGIIVRVDGRIVAIALRLDAEFYGADRGRWHIEAGFGRCATTPPLTFGTLSEVLIWIADRLGDGPDSVAELMDPIGPVSSGPAEAAMSGDSRH